MRAVAVFEGGDRRLSYLGMNSVSASEASYPTTVETAFMTCDYPPASARLVIAWLAPIKTRASCGDHRERARRCQLPNAAARRGRRASELLGPGLRRIFGQLPVGDIAEVNR